MRRAVIVGINKYPKYPLYGCENDALRMAKLLEVHHGGKPNFACHTLLSRDTKITRGVLRKAILALFADPADAALLYFSGHGVATERGGVLVTVDFKKNDEGIPMDEVIGLA